MKQQTKRGGQAAMIWRFLRRHIWLFAGAVLFSILNTLFSAMTPQVMRVTVDSLLGGEPLKLPAALLAALRVGEGGLERDLLLAAGAVLVSAALAGLCGYVAAMSAARCSQGFIKDMRDTLFAHIQKLPFSWHTAHQTGDIIQRCTSDVEVIRTFVTVQLLELFRIFFLVTVSFALMFSMNVKISLIAMAFLPVVAGYSILFYRKVGKRFLAADEAEGALTAVVQENLTGVRVVRAFGRERYEIDRFDEKNEVFAGFWIRLGKLLSVYWAGGDIVTAIQILVVMVAGVSEAVAGNISLGQFLAFLSYNSTMIWPVRSLGRVLSEMSKAGVSVERIRYILDAKEEAPPARPVTPPMDRDICFEGVHFGYPGEGPLLRDVSFTIPAGGTFAILGGTGSGKSTLVHLLARLYDVEQGQGRITIGGVDLREIPQDYVRRSVGLVLQEPFLFSRTVEENVKAVRPGATRDEVRAAARVACVDEALAEMHLGYDTIVGERGVTLSGGQKQRVAIARMLMQKAPILVFDDSLSAVDTETDARIRAALKEHWKGATVILISHRVTTLTQADHILVLEGGRVAEQGTHEELLRLGGLYRRTYDIQMNSEDRLLLEEEGGEGHGL